MFRGVSPLLQSMAVSQAKTLNVNIFCWLYNHVSETIRHVAKQVLQHLRMMDKMPYICKQLAFLWNFVTNNFYYNKSSQNLFQKRFIFNWYFVSRPDDPICKYTSWLVKSNRALFTFHSPFSELTFQCTLPFICLFGAENWMCYSNFLTISLNET